MRTIITVLAALPLLAVSSAQAADAGFCQAFQPILDAAQQGFEPLRGEATAPGEWRATRSVPQAVDCQVYDAADQPAGKNYTCRLTIAGTTVDPAAADYAEAIRSCAEMEVFGLVDGVWYLRTKETGVQVSMIQMTHPEPYIDLVVYEAD
ncbi:hypothetical protein ABAC460_15925 [Asticcacaulis sp. AC460]|uniref:hypothetical protein n=1 Tax=Asticcacaulis sp. AC460 TaxID=1282360 RepID=UPI0003C3E501|nr:hypothetical protein [Asticcacaulis sp. AC460]ESQ88147.1 hypothetical protein ABAC460_15925 [Asticcacaulis sp. AC460]